jgi:hypothetical protein
MKRILLTVVVLSCVVFPQSMEERKGNVSFISSQNIYVKFSNTNGITEGDTLFLKQGNALVPVMFAKYISTTSVAGELINGDILNVGDELYALAEMSEDNISEEVPQPDDFILPTIPVRTEQKPVKTSSEKISGKFGINSYSNYSNTARGDFQRWRYTLSFSGRNIGDSPLSVKSHMNFNYRTDQWSSISSNPVNQLRVYDLALLYELTNSTKFILGRHINEKITNIGPVDGLQVNQAIGDFNTGAFVGSRPDFHNLGYNLKMFQFGIYLNRTDTLNSRVMDNTIAFVNQTNDINTDRRILYFQHTNNYFTSLSFFASAEADLYKKVNEESKNELSLTGLFFSLRYNPFAFASVNLSYDARRNVIYYETFKNFLETLLENEMRQGLRGSITLRPYKNIFTGFNAGYRFRKGDPKPSTDLGAYISYSMLPYVEVSPSVSYSRIKSSYISGDIFGVMLTKHLSFAKSSISAVYRNSQYSFIRDVKSVQHSITTDLSYRISKHFYISGGWEGIFESANTSGRILFNLTSRL